MVDEDANYQNSYVSLPFCQAPPPLFPPSTDILLTPDHHDPQWCNRDLIPIPRDRQTWTWQGFAGYWVIGGQLHCTDQILVESSSDPTGAPRH
jgi:hypothetical protein